LANIKQIALPNNTIFVAISHTFQMCQIWQIEREKPQKKHKPLVKMTTGIERIR